MLRFTSNPAADRSASKNGDSVVLHADTDEIMLLTYFDNYWYIMSHQSVQTAEGSQIQEADFYYKRTGYIQEAAIGHACFDKSTPISTWQSFYEENEISPSS